MEGRFTLLFEDPFWVGYFERQDENGIQVAKFTFGAEPTSAELLAFIHRDFPRLLFSAPQQQSPAAVLEGNFKRRQREIRKQMSAPAASTRAQEIYQQELQRSLQKLKKSRKEESGLNKAAERQKALAKKLKKKLGH
jgi:Skp family chaperone for outer membrane proteins